MARRRNSLARGISCCSKFFISFARPVSLYCEEYVYIGLHLSDRVDTVYELPLLPNSVIIRVKHFYTNRERCEVLTAYLSLGRWPGGDWANT
jgi:hypothetical protein